MEASQNSQMIGYQTSTILTMAWHFPCWKRKGSNPSASNWGSSPLHYRNSHFYQIQLVYNVWRNPVPRTGYTAESQGSKFTERVSWSVFSVCLFGWAGSYIHVTLLWVFQRCVIIWLQKKCDGHANWTVFFLLLVELIVDSWVSWTVLSSLGKLLECLMFPLRLFGITKWLAAADVNSFIYHASSQHFVSVNTL